MTSNIKKKFSPGNIFLNLGFILFSLLFIIPFVYVASISLSNEQSLIDFGYKLIPAKFSLEAYQFAFANPSSLIDAYIVTIIQSVAGTAISIVIMAMCAYSLSRDNFFIKKPLTYYIFITMIFNGGLIPNYLFNTQVYNLQNNMLIYILPFLVNAFQIIIFRTFFKDLPPALIESAKIDGASEFTIFLRIVIPLSKPVFATIALFSLLDKWNNWYTSLIYITDPKLFTLQYLLQKILLDADSLKALMQDPPIGVDLSAFMNMTTPTESLRFAMCIIATGPMMIIFPLFQKYFTKGLTVGAVKG